MMHQKLPDNLHASVETFAGVKQFLNLNEKLPPHSVVPRFVCLFTSRLGSYIFLCASNSDLGWGECTALHKQMHEELILSIIFTSLN